MNSSVVYLGRSSVPLLDAYTYPKVLKVNENWVFSMVSTLIRMVG
jgi:hypothetical protein